MKRTIFLTVALTILISISIKGQERPGERLAAYRVAFFTKKLNLTPKEAEKFWPVYNEFQEKKNQIQLEKLKLSRYFNQNEASLSDKEMTELGNKYIGLELTQSGLIQEYHKVFMSILPPAKVLKLYQAENQYRLQLLQELRQNPQLKNNLKKDPGLDGIVDN